MRRYRTLVGAVVLALAPMTAALFASGALARPIEHIKQFHDEGTEVFADFCGIEGSTCASTSSPTEAFS
jgi:hypothetical protein